MYIFLWQTYFEPYFIQFLCKGSSINYVDLEVEDPSPNVNVCQRGGAVNSLLVNLSQGPWEFSLLIFNSNFLLQNAKMTFLKKCGVSVNERGGGKTSQTYVNVVYG